MSDTVFVLGRDEVGTIAEDRNPTFTRPMRYYLTACCGASAKGLEDYVGCRRCYQEIDPALGGVPDRATVFVTEQPVDDPYAFHDVERGGWWTDVTVPLELIEVYGDGIPYADWKARTFGKAVTS